MFTQYLSAALHEQYGGVLKRACNIFFMKRASTMRESTSALKQIVDRRNGKARDGVGTDQSILKVWCLRALEEVGFFLAREVVQINMDKL